MKYKGKKLEGVNTDFLVLTRGNEQIVLKASAIKDYNHFNSLCSMPEAPMKILPGGVREPDNNNPTFRRKLEEYANNKTNYTIIYSLKATEELEWDTVDYEKPDTWSNWNSELQEAGFTEVEVMRIMQLCIKVNALDDDLLDQAKETFLAGALPQEA